jgi:hypothetical protein
MILAEIDLTATKILTPGFDIGRLPRCWRASRETRRRREPTNDGGEKSSMIVS